jgi:hypothetical protein
VRREKPPTRRLAGGAVYSGDDASVLTGLLRVGREGARGREVKIALEGEAQGTADFGEFVQAYIAEFRFAEPQVAKAEGQGIHIGVELCEEPGGIAVGGEELYDGFKVEALILAVDGGELGASVLEELLALSEGDELHVN